jgi:hypothetical protein
MSFESHKINPLEQAKGAASKWYKSGAGKYLHSLFLGLITAGAVNATTPADSNAANRDGFSSGDRNISDLKLDNDADNSEKTRQNLARFFYAQDTSAGVRTRETTDELTGMFVRPDGPTETPTYNPASSHALEQADPEVVMTALPEKPDFEVFVGDPTDPNSPEYVIHESGPGLRNRDVQIANNSSGTPEVTVGPVERDLP